MSGLTLVYNTSQYIESDRVVQVLDVFQIRFSPPRRLQHIVTIPATRGILHYLQQFSEYLQTRAFHSEKFWVPLMFVVTDGEDKRKQRKMLMK